jgi:hypothetical protein
MEVGKIAKLNREEWYFEAGQQDITLFCLRVRHLYFGVRDDGVSANFVHSISL